MILPFTEGYEVIDTEFVNFDKQGSAAIGVTAIDGTCTVFCGGWEAQFSGITFDNSANKAAFRCRLCIYCWRLISYVILRWKHKLCWNIGLQKLISSIHFHYCAGNCYGQMIVISISYNMSCICSDSVKSCDAFQKDMIHSSNWWPKMFGV